MLFKDNKRILRQVFIEQTLQSQPKPRTLQICLRAAAKFDIDVPTTTREMQGLLATGLVDLN